MKKTELVYMNNKVEILLVEDNANDAEMVIRVLKKNNLANKLLHVKDGAEALDFIFGRGAHASRSMDDKIKLIILDLKMPKVNGFEVLATIKADERTKHIPVVILTSSREDPDIEKCYKMGVNSYVVKPVVFSEFVKAVTNLGFYWLIVNESPS